MNREDNNQPKIYNVQDFKKEFGFNALRKVMQFHGHEAIQATELTDRCTFRLNATCNSCSNCNGSECAEITVSPPPEQPKGKTLDQCKDDVAKENGFSSWKDLLKHQINIGLINRDSDEANKRFYAQSLKGKGVEWRLTESELPEIGHSVEVITEYQNKGEPESQRFIGYMDEQGDLFSLPEDGHYGWTFEECVIQWRCLTPPTI